MEHADARTFASARADGELDPAGAPALDEHLRECAECRSFAAQLGDLGTLARRLPRPAAPAGLAERVAARIASRRRAVPSWRLAPAAAAVLALALLLAGVGPVTFPLPRAEAADALTRLESLFVEREVVEELPGGPRARVRERIWFRAPDLTRIEREFLEGPSGIELEIRRPGEIYVKGPGVEDRVAGLPPGPAFLPEPLSPTAALLGVRRGPGPVVAGRPTERVAFAVAEGIEQEALVDAARFTALGAEEATVVGKVVLEKRAEAGPRVLRRKRTIAIRYNLALPDSLFEIPERPPARRDGVRPGLPTPRSPVPAAVPRGFALLRVGTIEQGNVFVYAKGAFPVIVWTGPAVPGPGELERRDSVAVGKRPATLVAHLYALPRVEFSVGGRPVAVAAPLPPGPLAALAAEMFPETE